MLGGDTDQRLPMKHELASQARVLLALVLPLLVGCDSGVFHVEALGRILPDDNNCFLPDANNNIF